MWQSGGQSWRGGHCRGLQVTRQMGEWGTRHGSKVDQGTTWQRFYELWTWIKLVNVYVNKHFVLVREAQIFFLYTYPDLNFCKWLIISEKNMLCSFGHFLLVYKYTDFKTTNKISNTKWFLLVYFNGNITKMRNLTQSKYMLLLMAIYCIQ